MNEIMNNIHRIIATFLWKHTGYHKSPFVCMHAYIAIYDGEHFRIIERCDHSDGVVDVSHRFFCSNCHKLIMHPGWSDE